MNNGLSAIFHRKSSLKFPHIISGRFDREQFLKAFLLLLMVGVVFGVNGMTSAKGFLEDAFILQSSGGGLSLGVVQLNTTELNTTLNKYGYPALGNVMVMYGGGLFSETEKHLRYTDFIYTGSMASTAQDGKYTKLSWSHGGLAAEQMFHIFKFLAVSVGGSGSYGSLKLQLINSKPDDFEDAIANPQQTVMSGKMFMVKPEVGVYVPVWSSVNLELKAGYYYSYMPGDWKLNHQSIKLDGGPMKQMHGASLMLNINLGF